MKATPLLLALCACDGVFGLTHLQLMPDAPPPDADTSGWPTDGGIEPTPCMTDSMPDEDGDRRQDYCDNCPAAANEDQLDTDRDGIGDICDPHVMFAVERRVYFNGFATATEGTAIGGIGSWQLAGGMLSQTGGTVDRTFFMFDGGPWRGPVVELKLANIRRNGTRTSWFAGVAFTDEGVVAPNADQTNCRIENAADFLETARIRATQQSALSRIPIAETPDPITLVFTSGLLEVRPGCHGDRGVESPSELTSYVPLTPDASDPETAKVGVWTLAAKADFHSITVYETTFMTP